MARIVVHNYMSRNIGRFRATAPVRDRVSDCGCGCGGAGTCGHAHDGAPAELAIDVVYTKGPMGRKINEPRHYTVPVEIDPKGRSPDPAFVATQLRRIPDHQRMIKDGWTADKAEGYFKREHRDVGARV